MAGKMGTGEMGSSRVGRVREDTRVKGERGSAMQGDGSDTAGIKGREHLAYINSLPYTVQVGEPPKLIKGMIT